MARTWRKIVYVTGSQGIPSLYLAKPSPASPDDLHNLFYTMRKKGVIQFDYGDSGKTASFVVQVENSSGKQSPWKPLLQALIP